MTPPFLQPHWPIPTSGFWLYILNFFNWSVLVFVLAFASQWHYFMSTLPMFEVLNLKLLNHRLRNMLDYIRGETKVDRCRQANAFLIECVERHINIKRNIDELQSLSGKFLFLDFIFYSIQLCFLLFQITSSPDLFLLIFSINFITTKIMILFLYYYHANEIIVHVSLN